MTSPSKQRDVLVTTCINLTEVLTQTTPREVISHYGHERLLQEIGFERVQEYMKRVNGEPTHDLEPPTTEAQSS